MSPAISPSSAAGRSSAAILPAGLEPRLRALVENIEDVICLADAQGRIGYLSPSVERVLGYTPEERVGRSIFDLLHPQAIPLGQATFREALDSPGRTCRAEGPVVHKDGSCRHVEAAVTNLLGDPAVGAVVVNYRDVTLRRQALEATERQRLEHALLEAGEREQRRIGQDLHDHLCQHLLGVACIIKALATQAEGGSPLPPASLHQAATLVNDAVGQARAVARGLHPVALDSAGLMSALRELAERTSETVPCDLRAGRAILIDDPGVAQHVYRIAQEAVGNALRHARPSHITIQLEVDAGRVTLTVADDGRGFPAGSGTVDGTPATGNGGMGCELMRYRARAIGGSLQVETRPDGGTQVICSFPLPP